MTTTTTTLYRAYQSALNAHDNYKDVNPWTADRYLQIACKIYELFIESDKQDLQELVGH